MISPLIAYHYAKSGERRKYMLQAELSSVRRTADCGTRHTLGQLPNIQTYRSLS